MEVGNYFEEKNKQMEEYGKLKAKYEEIAESKEYLDICQNMPFSFLSAKQSAEFLNLAKEMGENSKMSFKRADEAISLFAKIIETRKQKDELLNKASLVIKVSGMARDINKLVSDSPYLTSSLKIEEGGSIVSIARKCIEMLPTYPDLMTKAFQVQFTEACLSSLSKNGVDLVVNAKYITKNIFPKLKNSGSDLYNENYAHLAKVFAIDESSKITTKVFKDIKVSGVTYANDDGSSRQEIIKEIASKTLPVPVDLKKTMFEEKNAVEIRYNEAMIGYLPQQWADTFAKEYPDSTLSGEITTVTGGKDGLSFGLRIDVTANIPTKTQDFSAKEEVER